MQLQQRFTELLLNIGFPKEKIQNHFEGLTKAYSKKNRHYHNLNHLEEMFSCFDTYKTKLEFPDEVAYAIFYHDYIYNSARKDNELMSATYAIKILPKDNHINKERVYDMILATKDHVCKGNGDQKWLIDFDLKILSKDWEEYAVYFQQIRKEYRIYPNFLYKPGRKKALEHFLENKTIFQTAEFKMLYEDKARQNIALEIESLTS